MELEIREYLAPLRKWWWLILVTTAIAAVSSYFATRQQTLLYQSTTTLMVGNAIENPNPSSVEFSTTRQLASFYVDIANRASVRQDVQDALGLNWLPEISVRQPNNANLIDVVVMAPDPMMAQAVAAELAQQMVLRSPTAKEEDAAFVEELLRNYETQIKETQVELESLQEKLGTAVGAREIAQIQGDINTLESTRQTLLTNYANLRSSTQRGATNTISIIEPASEPRSPSTPNNMITVLTAAGIGFVLSASAAYVLEYLDDSVKTPNSASRLTGLPTLTGIATIVGDNKLVTIGEPRSPTSEAFRVLRTAIQFSDTESEKRTLLVTSPVPGDGKSTTASNLAVVMSQAGNHVLLVDTDLRRPSLHRIFNLSNKRGLTSLLLALGQDEDTGDMRGLVTDTAQTTQVEGLRVLACGPIPPNPSELLGSPKMQRLLGLLAEQFDYVILDSSPTLSVTDAAVLSTQADGTILVVRANRSRKDHVKQSIERLHEVNANMLGVVLNSLAPGTEGYGAYYYYQDPYYAYGESGEPAAEGKPVGKLRKRLQRKPAA
ncbi:MAG: polysaccharide biosynthesis tyrosine autokinase [Anaerolineae bacterium]